MSKSELPLVQVVPAATEPPPWYQDGLQFTCTQCGRCCTGEPGFVWVDAGEIETLAHSQNMPVEEFIAVYTKRLRGRRTLREKPSGDCVFYDRRRGCTVYGIRPKQCQTWPFWESNLHTPEDWQGIVEICPGAGTGELIPSEEITRRVQLIKM
jgi:Fe-S-cluster containining protein